MDFKLFSDVALLKDIREQHLFTGDVGTIVERHDIPGKEPGYSIEFFDMLGKTIAVITLPGSLLRAQSHEDVPAVRTLMMHEDS